MSREEIQARRDAMRAALAAKEEAQALVDLAALADAEEEHGYDTVRSLPFRGFVEGLPTLAVVRRPTGLEYKRYMQVIRTAKTDLAKSDAQLLLGETCLVYPPKGELRTRMLEVRGGCLVVAGTSAARMAEAEDEEEKKG